MPRRDRRIERSDVGEELADGERVPSARQASGAGLGFPSLRGIP